MADKSDIECGDANLRTAGEGTNAAKLKAWFVREVLPLEAMLVQFIRKSSLSQADVEDVRQDVYMRIYEIAQKRIPQPTRPLLFRVARDFLIDRARRQQVVSIEAVENLEALNLAIDEPGPERTVMAREELRILQASLDKLPERFRQAVVMKKIDGLSTREIALRLGIAEKTAEKYLTEGVQALAHVLYREPPAVGGEAS
jgi:RNA polymerase sigma factor (sigma-70 family)